MDTVKKGDEFEKEALGIVHKLIDDKLIGQLREFLKVKEKPKYYSSQREGYITFDLSIEYWPPGADTYSMIYIVECKNYKKRVGVDQIQKFKSDVEQVTGQNVKSVFITKTPLQEGGKNYARNNGIMVIEAHSLTNYKIVLYSKRRSADETGIPFFSISSSPKDDVIFRQIENQLDEAILDGFYNPATTYDYNFGIQYLSKADIAAEANSLLKAVKHENSPSIYPIKKEEIFSYLKSHQVVVKYFKNPQTHFGACDLGENTVYLSQNIKDTPKELFVLAHELGHFHLHHSVVLDQNLNDRFKDSKSNFLLDKHLLKNPKNWIEWQANYFAASLLMPKETLYYWLDKIQKDLGLSKKRIIYFDDQACNLRDGKLTIDFLQKKFNVSGTAIRYRLNEFSIIKEKSRIRKLGDVYRDEYFV